MKWEKQVSEVDIFRSMRCTDAQSERESERERYRGDALNRDRDRVKEEGGEREIGRYRERQREPEWRTERLIPTGREAVRGNPLLSWAVHSWGTGVETYRYWTLGWIYETQCSSPDGQHHMGILELEESCLQAASCPGGLSQSSRRTPRLLRISRGLPPVSFPIHTLEGPSETKLMR